MTQADVVVVGGGIVGAAVAYHLARAGVATVVVDDARPGHATRAGAGIVCPVTATVGEPRLVDLAFSAADHYPTLAAWLDEDGAGAGTSQALGGDASGWSLVGMLSTSLAGGGSAVAAGADHVEATSAWARHIAATTGYGHLTDHRPVGAAEARELCPLLPPDLPGAVLLPWGARVDGDRFRAALLDAAERRGARRRPGTVERVEPVGDAARVVVGGEVLAAGCVVVCAGAWSGRLLPAAGGVAASRGEVLHVVADGLDTAGWPLVEIEGTGPYLIPWGGGRVGVGATVEPTTDFDARPSIAGLRWGIDALDRAAPGQLGRFRLVECRVGFRPTSPDGLPLIGPVPGTPQVLLATGHGADGLSWGPYTGRLVAELVTGESPSIDLTPFAPARFADPAPRAPAGRGGTGASPDYAHARRSG